MQSDLSNNSANQNDTVADANFGSNPFFWSQTLMISRSANAAEPVKMAIILKM